ncbi:hypothetical protein [Streptomyces jeddahensis]|uniref:hypothetical protein n=1 Tax=Streptomyces jeddahensis TaxID=1716141 RepID=UPI0012FF6CE0|nr:hypothetical protein [Streptomyces jeddahensis]
MPGSAQQFRTDHDIHYLAHALAGRSQRHVREIADIGKRYGAGLGAEPAGEPTVTERLREKGIELIGRRGEAALLLLRVAAIAWVGTRGSGIRVGRDRRACALRPCAVRRRPAVLFHLAP